MEAHKKNIEQYLQSGGDAKTAKRIALPTLANRAKISYLLSKIDSTDLPKVEILNIGQNLSKTTPKEIPEDLPEPSKPKFLGLIAQYPVELHSMYLQCYNLWISICSLKINLNAVPDDEDKTAYQIQSEIMEKINLFDKNKKTLDHYAEFKRILPTETKSDFSQLTPIQILQKRNNIRSLITRRNQTIEAMEKDLPKDDAKDYNKKIAAINRKKEQLQELVLDEAKLNELMK